MWQLIELVATEELAIKRIAILRKKRNRNNQNYPLRRIKRDGIWRIEKWLKPHTREWFSR